MLGCNLFGCDTVPAISLDHLRPRGNGDPYEVPTAVTVKNTIWDLTWCSLVDVSRNVLPPVIRVALFCPESGDSIFLRNVGKLLSDYMASQLKCSTLHISKEVKINVTVTVNLTLGLMN
jgi:hypothetical protein